MSIYNSDGKKLIDYSKIIILNDQIYINIQAHRGVFILTIDLFILDQSK